MTEEEAKAKWCPFARVGSDGNKGSGWNRPERESFGHRAKIGGENHCIASACMAWRGHTRLETRHRDGHVVRPGEVYIRGNSTTHEVPDGGFCGLAGAPR